MSLLGRTMLAGAWHFPAYGGDGFVYHFTKRRVDLRLPVLLPDQLRG